MQMGLVLLSEVMPTFRGTSEVDIHCVTFVPCPGNPSRQHCCVTGALCMTEPMLKNIVVAYRRSVQRAVGAWGAADPHPRPLRQGL